MSEINAISSSCKLCLFAIYDGDTQVGCELNRVEKVKNHNTYELIEATDDEKNFYVLNNHICPYQRTNNWIHADSNDRKAMVEKEVYMKWVATIIAHTYDIDLIEKRLQEISSQNIKPSAITLALNNCPNIEEIFKIMDKYTDIWYLQNNLYDDTSDRFIIDSCFDKMKRQKFLFYGVFEVDKPINPDFYKRVHKYVIEDMNQYGILKHKDTIHEMVVSKLIHVKYAGNANGIDLEDKVLNDNKSISWSNLEKEKIEAITSKFVTNYNTIEI